MMQLIQQHGLDNLSVSDRVALAEELLESVHEARANEPISPELRAELERRIAQTDSDPTLGTPWETVRAEARARHYAY